MEASLLTERSAFCLIFARALCSLVTTAAEERLTRSSDAPQISNENGHIRHCRAQTLYEIASVLLCQRRRGGNTNLRTIVSARGNEDLAKLKESPDD